MKSQIDPISGRRTTQPAGDTELATVVAATAITEVLADGQKLTGLVLAYPTEIDGSRLHPDCFEVSERSVTDVFTATGADPRTRAPSGHHVVISLSLDDSAAPLRIKPPQRAGSGPPMRELQLGKRPPLPAPEYKSAVATVRQVRDVHTATGAVLSPFDEPLRTSCVRELVVEDFCQRVFHDPETGDTLPYNLFVPADYDGSQTYPLVLFMHDAGVASDDPLTTLRQGLGAISWAQPENQAKHPCLVLAPQYSTVIVNDDSEASSALETTVHLVQEVVREYAVDEDRIYATGQSGGAMMSMAINIAYPDLFAGSVIVAGQWDARKSIPLATQALWIIVAEGDIKAFPGQNAITATLESNGATVARAIWDGRLPTGTLDAEAAALAASDAMIKYAVLRKGTVVPDGQLDNPVANHVNTWRIAYTLRAVREWLFQQHRGRNGVVA